MPPTPTAASMDRRRFRVVDGGAPSSRPPIPDSALIDAFESGDRSACDLLYDRLIGVVEGTLFRVLGRRDAHHDDLVQAAFEQIVLTLSKRQFARACSLASWATSVTSHVAFNAIRSRTRERKVVDPGRDSDLEAGVHSGKIDVEKQAGARQVLERARFHLAQMDETRATTLFLHDVLGHDLAEIAVLTSVSVAAAQSRLVRGRKELRKRLSKEGLINSEDEQS